MCGRFTLRTPMTVLAQQFLFDLGGVPPDLMLRPRFNIAPTQTVAVIRQPAAGGPREFGLLRWGLIPSWAKDTKIGATMINARAETLAEKPAFRAAFAKRRCLILADGFYEWKKEGQQKLPYYFQLADQRPFAFAGLWERWRGPPADSAEPQAPIESCTIITTTANELCAPLHDRMPVILEPAAYGRWLDPAFTESRQLLDLLAPLPASQMQSRPVNPRVNSVRNDDEGLLVAEQSLFS
jgi:putative SOS response-associated peptidase YedK